MINHVHVSEPMLEIIQRRDIHSNVIRTLLYEGYKGFISIEMKCCNDIRLISDAMMYLKNIVEKSERGN